MGSSNFSQELYFFRGSAKSSRSHIERPGYNVKQLKVLVDSIKRNGFAVTNVLPINFVKDASVDYTKYIQLALNKHPLLIFPSFPVLVNDSGLVLRDNQMVYFPRGSVIRLKENDKPKYAILLLRAIHNITLVNPCIIGDRYQHYGNKGEWGMGIQIQSAKNVTIYNPTVRNCWGDGIYIGQWTKLPSENITIYDALCSHNRRDGVSITSADSVYMVNPKSDYSDGTFPMAGIDIEPDVPINSIQNIVIENAITKMNKGKGIQIALSNMYSDKSIPSISIRIDNPIDSMSGYGLRFVCSVPGRFKNQAGLSSFAGSIIINNPVLKENAKKPVESLYLDQYSPNIFINNPSVISNGVKLSDRITEKIIQDSGPSKRPKVNSTVRSALHITYTNLK